MSKFKFAVLDPMHEDGLVRAREEADVVEAYGREPGSESKVAAAVKDADAIMCRGTLITAELIAGAPNLKVVAKHGAGVDNVDKAALTAAGIPLANTPGGANSTAVSEGAVMMMLALLKQTLTTHERVLKGDFKMRFSFRAADMWERTVGIIGIGNIGTHVARICGKGFNMRVLAYDPYLTKEQIAAKGAEQVDSLPEMLALADVVTIHTPLTPETKWIVGAKEFAMMKPSAILVNTSRGPTVNEAALVEALRTKKIAGAGIDVFEDEPPAPDNPLLQLTGVNVLFSPHTAGLTAESTRQMAIMTAEVALDVLHGRRPETLLNPEVWEKRRVAVKA